MSVPLTVLLRVRALRLRVAGSLQPARTALASSFRRGRLWLRRTGRRVRRLARARSAATGPALRITLQARLLLVLVSIAGASTGISALLQDRSLSLDLASAAQGRLEEVAAMVSQLTETHLASQVERCRTVASTSQFLANVETGHAPTLARFAQDLAATHEAAAVSFLAADGSEIAGAGDAGLRRRALATTGTTVLAAARSRFLSQQGVPYVAVHVPLRDADRVLGAVVVTSRIGERVLQAWSRLSRARVWIGDGTGSSDPSLLVRALGEVELRVALPLAAEREALANSRWSLFTGGLVGLALASAVSLVVARSLVRPIVAIQTAAERIRHGELDFRLDDRRRDEVGDVARAFNHMLESLAQNIAHRERAERQRDHQARHDSITGLGNRRLLRDRGAQAFAYARRRGTQVGAIHVGLDRFKDVNDTLGHGAGDELLAAVAGRLRACITSLDLDAPEDREVVFPARLGGDEFALVLPCTDAQGLARVAERVLAALNQPYVVLGRDLAVPASVGIATAGGEGDIETLLREADMAMHEAKAQGGARVERYSDSMQTAVARRLALDNELRHALANDEFQLFYQPKLDLLANRITGMEALLRWTSRTHGMIGPDEFIPRIEETGAIVPIGAWVLRTAMQQAAQWQQPGSPPVGVAVNVSGRQIEQGDAFAAEVERLLDATGLDPKLLELEITEGVLLHDPDAAVRVCERLRRLGIRWALDDFGTGYSSLSQLRRLPIDTLKVDRSFVRGAVRDAAATALIGSIIELAKVVDLRVVVEGVETRAQRRLLENLGCDEIQGYLIGEPMAAAAAAELLRGDRRRARRPRRKAPAWDRR